MKLITMIVPVYKIKEEYLRHCLDSLMFQKSEDFKVILVDDGSPDNCGAICDEYAQKSSIFHVIHQNNAGVSMARNAGIDAADTEWITFVDPDDWLDDNAIEQEENAIRSANDADIIMFDYSREYVNMSQVESLNIESGMLDEKIVEACRKAPFFKLFISGKVNPYSINALWNKIYRRDFVNSIGIRFIPEAKKGQDRLFNATAFCATNHCYYLNKHLYNYRCNEGSVSNRFNSNIVELTLIEIKELKNVIKDYNLSVEDLLDARICTRLYSCMRLYYFHPNNPKPERDCLKEFKSLVSKEPFCSALKNVDMNLLSAGEKLFVLSIKYRMYWLCGKVAVLKARGFREDLNR